MNLSKNFTLQELVASSKASKYNINNTPNAEQLANLKKLAETVLQPIRDEFKQPIKVSSGFRCPKVNSLVGGAKNSDHIFGAAADIHTVADTHAENKKLWDLIIKMTKDGKIKCRQIIDEYNLNWIHVSINHNKNS
jgi:hypothetical protein